MGNKSSIFQLQVYASFKSLLSLFVSCRTVVVTIVVYRTVISVGGEFSPYSSGIFLLRFRYGCAMQKFALQVQILLSYSSSGSNDWINVGSERKIKLIEEEQISQLRVERLLYDRHSSLAGTGYDIHDGCKKRFSSLGSYKENGSVQMNKCSSLNYFTG